MNRWALLEHKIFINNYQEIHYDFLVQYGEECLTWKIFQLPKKKGTSVEIINQHNHRLIWLFEKEAELSKDRGHVKRIDYGSYVNQGKELNNEEFSLVLDGQLMMGLFQKIGNMCKLT
tara:strand:+ start:3104 stop:3457 length:354 start_codon:yes stop_codon:yes gene_type:complete